MTKRPIIDWHGWKVVLLGPGLPFLLLCGLVIFVCEWDEHTKKWWKFLIE